jgi:hypothetical protein
LNASVTMKLGEFCIWASQAFARCFRAPDRDSRTLCGGVVLVGKLIRRSMKPCEHESIVAAAVSRGELPENLRVHIEQCSACSATFSIAQRLQRMAAAYSEESQPTASSMWWRLRVRSRQENLNRAEKPLIWMQRIFVVAMIFLCATLMAAAWQAHPSEIWGVGLLSLGGVVVPITIAFWRWSRSRS